MMTEVIDLAESDGEDMQVQTATEPVGSARYGSARKRSRTNDTAWNEDPIRVGFTCDVIELSDDEASIHEHESKAEFKDMTDGLQAGTDLSNSRPMRSLTGITHVSETILTAGETSGELRGASDEATSPQLSHEQAAVERIVLNGKSIFFTGNAGTGKSFLLARIIQRLRTKHGKSFHTKVAVTAATGIAATHIGGTTLHSFAGCGVPNKINDFQRILKDPSALDRWSLVETLIIDEISMVSAELFDKLNKVAQIIRKNPKAWGGIQMVLCGDFFQLPPISKRFSPNLPEDTFFNRGFTFQAPVWNQMEMESVLLEKVFRQRNPEFVNILNDVRKGKASQAIAALMARCQRPLPEANGVRPTQIFSRNLDVDEVNSREIGLLSGQEEVFHADDNTHPSAGGDYERKRAALQQSDFFRDCLAHNKVALKVGAQVMLLKNLELQGAGGANRMLVNGSRGVVEAFVRVDEAQKMLGSFTKEKEAMLGGFKGKFLPKVKFTNGRSEVIIPSEFSVEVGNLGKCTRKQIPLKLAWALTIHKCQGMTLDMAKVSLRNMFAEGQAYVALSRARSMEGLEVMDGNPSCVKVSPCVQQFYQCLERGEQYTDSSWAQWQKARQPAGDGGDGPRARDGPGGGVGSRPSSTCYSCGSEGHWSSACPRRTGGQQQSEAGVGAYAALTAGIAGAVRGQRRAQAECFKCGQVGHYSKTCPNGALSSRR